MFDELLCVVNDSRSAENEIIPLMLYREAFLPPGPRARQLYGPLVRKIKALDQRLLMAIPGYLLILMIQAPKVIVTFAELSSRLV